MLLFWLAPGLEMLKKENYKVAQYPKPWQLKFLLFLILPWVTGYTEVGHTEVHSFTVPEKLTEP